MSNLPMSGAHPGLAVPRPDIRSTAENLAAPARLATITLLALIAYYFVGFDQGAVSVFGEDTRIHEFLHDARHLLGFPCH
ncbi:CbtB domain-containing protein [Mycolicibacterium sp. F2034L]|uniref:CbtB domain-containing protein n=1 Tax=Mycolicibacterium sp. F2034L TaxID=2926422 RepID=UPI0035A8E495